MFARMYYLCGMDGAINPAAEPLDLAMNLVEHTGANLFLTGRAGTGKTTLLRALRERTAKRTAVAAPTGIAAINAGGVTLHSLFQLPFAPFVPGSSSLRSFRFSKEKQRLIRALDLLIIDEISMVRADLLDAVDAMLRRLRDPSRPFGGVQLLLVGDLLQLAPVARDEEWELLAQHYPSPFFFESHALREAGFETIELTNVFRQTDAEFLSLLNDVRSGAPSQATIHALNKRCRPDFIVPPGEDYVRLTTHNAQARSINSRELDSLAGSPEVFKAEVEGDFPESMYPTDLRLELKAGAQVMFVKNDSSGTGRYYNGLIGRITDIEHNYITVAPRDGQPPIRVSRELWENVRYTLSDDSDSAELKEEVIGSFRQFPLRTAWAITIHKSQGLTFSHAIIDASFAFAPGQTYVALSRCRSLDGLVLSAPVTRRCIMSDASVASFMQQCASTPLTPQRIALLEREFTLRQLDELFGMKRLADSIARTGRLAAEYLEHSHPDFTAAWRDMAARFKTEAVDVARRFARQYASLQGEALQLRVRKAAAYFADALGSAQRLLADFPRLHSNSAVQQRIGRAVDSAADDFALAEAMLRVFAGDTPFTPLQYMRAKLKYLSSTEKPSGKIRKASADSAVENPRLLAALNAWRKECLQSGAIKRSHLPTAAQMRAIAAVCPQSAYQLGSIPGIGKAKLAASAQSVLRIVAEYMMQEDSEDTDKQQTNQ